MPAPDLPPCDDTSASQQADCSMSASLPAAVAPAPSSTVTVAPRLEAIATAADDAPTAPGPVSSSDADWAGNKDDYSSTSAFVVYLGCNPISWSSKKQNTIAQSSTEAEYRTVAATAAVLNWVCFILTDLGLTLTTVPVIYCDNVGATQLCSNPIFHSRMKHVAIDFHFIRDQV
ncbi:hypothetical protein LWI29_016072 [Acer saccharum]|uniref:Uncharacterized protein n=1 Tax=Acer saccharum TaxID=4024 RepID=A0AA39RKZ0_ACESA|nr:hypothetical protein LWI29_016072 [Acer saccharum]